MKPVIQQEITGCGIASFAAIAGMSYPRGKEIANRLGIYAKDSSLWSDPQPLRTLLASQGIATSPQQTPFRDWASLPDCALLATKWHLEQGKPFWHWAVFVREAGQKCVLDSRKSLKQHRRTDFGRIKPKWFIEVASTDC